MGMEQRRWDPTLDRTSGNGVGEFPSDSNHQSGRIKYWLVVLYNHLTIYILCICTYIYMYTLVNGVLVFFS